MTKILIKERKREASRPGSLVKPTRKIAVISLAVLISITSVGALLMAIGIGAPAAGWKGIP